MKTLVEISDRYSSKGKSGGGNLSGGTHPYAMLDNQSSKKSIKKKSESIDMMSKKSRSSNNNVIRSSQ